MLSVDDAVDRLSGGGVVAVPTETVYGLAADGLRAQSVARIFAAKGRPADNPLILHVAGVEQAWPLWRVSERERDRALRLASLWPGPLTMVLPSAEHVPAVVRAGLDTVAVRAPDHPVAQAILAGFGGPLAAPSANASGRPSPTTAAHVLRDLGDRIDGVVDGGACTVGVESTVVDLRGPMPRVLRPGSVSRERLEAALGEPVTAYEPGFVAGSPGLRHVHYRPDVASVRALTDADAQWSGPDALVVFASTAGRMVARYGARTAPIAVLPDAPDAAMRSKSSPPDMSSSTMKMSGGSHEQP